MVLWNLAAFVRIFPAGRDRRENLGVIAWSALTFVMLNHESE